MENIIEQIIQNLDILSLWNAKVLLKGTKTQHSGHMGQQISNWIKDTLWVSAPTTLGLCVFLNIFAVYACKLTYYIPNESWVSKVFNDTYCIIIQTK